MVTTTKEKNRADKATTHYEREINVETASADVEAHRVVGILKVNRRLTLTAIMLGIACFISICIVFVSIFERKLCRFLPQPQARCPLTNAVASEHLRRTYWPAC